MTQDGRGSGGAGTDARAGSIFAIPVRRPVATSMFFIGILILLTVLADMIRRRRELRMAGH